MAYELKVDGMAEISDLLGKLEEAAPAVAAQAVYEGAGIVADAVRKGAESIKTEPLHHLKHGRRYPTPEEKQIIIDAGIGIAKFDKNGTEVDTSVGYRNAGYAELNGKVKPIPVIVNAVNSGTSFMVKQPFIRQAARTAGNKATQKMKEKIDSAFEQYLKEMSRL